MSQPGEAEIFLLCETGTMDSVMGQRSRGGYLILGRPGIPSVLGGQNVLRGLRGTALSGISSSGCKIPVRNVWANLQLELRASLSLACLD